MPSSQVSFHMLFHIDAVLTHWINSPAGLHPWLDDVVIASTRAIIPLMVLAVAVRWWARREREQERHIAIEAALTFIVGLLINQAILLFLTRVRPYDAGITHLIVAPSSDPSFPSDHATGAVAIVAAIWLNQRPRRAMLFALPAVLLMMSRVYVGTHYVSDVLGGGATALVAAVTVHATTNLRAPVSAILIRIL